MAVPFLLLSALVLGLWSEPRGLLPTANESTHSLVLILTTSELRPAFESLQSWNEARGCRTVLIPLGSEEARDHPEWILASVATVCSRAGVTGLLLGADRSLLPLPDRPGSPFPSLVPSAWGAEPSSFALLPRTPSRGLPSGLPVGRAEVESLDEAWAFVESCRGTGQTLDVLLLRTQLHAEGAVGLSSSLVRAPGR